MEQTIRNRLVYVTALLWVAAQIYIAFAPVPGMIIRPLHVSFCLILVFLLYPAFKNKPRLSLGIDAGPVLVIILFMVYSVYYGDRIVTRLPFVDDLFASDYFFNFVLVVLLLEAGRRVLGWSMTIVALVFMAYSFFGADLPGILAHPVVSVADFVENQTMTSSGIYSSPIAASSDTIFYFMIFGAYLAATPAGTLFVAMAKYATRKAVGGAGKASIIASGLFGMISGSAAANVASVGTIVYPMMEKARYKPVFSAALLATAGTGGQLIPPVMGASAFIMADMIGVSYFKIVLCAIIPSMLYVGSLFWEVHLESYKQKMKPEILDKDELLASIKRYFHLILPIVILVGLIAWGRSLMYSALMSTLSLIVLCQLKKDTRIPVKGIIKMAVDGAKSSV
ncbi:MAG: TRAP transporter large permease subunit, partial [Synergistaceae bacterium]|nr:TRAP transporter large permease subunit [Synergistaceae bacterium]